VRWDQWNHTAAVLVDHAEPGLEGIGLEHRHLAGEIGCVLLSQDIDLVAVGRIDLAVVGHILPVGHAGSRHVLVLRMLDLDLDLGCSSVDRCHSIRLVVADLGGRLAGSYLGRNHHVVVVDRIGLGLGHIDLAGPGRSLGCIDRKDPTL